jgi:DNA-binding NarL/FixJ family response regulator
MMGPTPIPIPEFFTATWYDQQKQLRKTDPVIADELLISKPLLDKWKRVVGCKPYQYRHMKGMSWEERQEIITLRKQGLTLIQIAEKVGKSPGTIKYHVYAS